MKDKQGFIDRMKIQQGKSGHWFVGGDICGDVEGSVWGNIGGDVGSVLGNTGVDIGLSTSSANDLAGQSKLQHYLNARRVALIVQKTQNGINAIMETELKFLQSQLAGRLSEWDECLLHHLSGFEFHESQNNE